MIRKFRKWTGVVSMTQARYEGLATLMGSKLTEHRPEPIPIGEPSGDEQCALYVAVNAGGWVCYGGQTRPSVLKENAAARRISQHLFEADKAESWTHYWVFPLDPNIHPDDLNQLERDLNARLGIPLRRRRRR